MQPALCSLPKKCWDFSLKRIWQALGWEAGSGPTKIGTSRNAAKRRHQCSIFSLQVPNSLAYLGGLQQHLASFHTPPAFPDFLSQLAFLLLLHWLFCLCPLTRVTLSALCFSLSSLSFPNWSRPLLGSCLLLWQQWLPKATHPSSCYPLTKTTSWAGLPWMQVQGIPREDCYPFSMCSEWKLLIFLLASLFLLIFLFPAVIFSFLQTSRTETP